jgi:hypothetical protein
MRCRLADFGLCERARNKAGAEITGWGNDAFSWVDGWSDSRFLADVAGQDDLFRRHVDGLIRQARQLQLDRFVGTQWAALFLRRGIEIAPDDDFEITLSGIVGAAHLAGMGGVRALLLRGVDRNDGRTRTSDYLRRFAGIF